MLENFYPRPPRGGRRLAEQITQASAEISIHALREEGDTIFKIFFASSAWNFYPRPPRGGRPPLLHENPYPLEISIHALREEGDHSPQYLTATQLIFLSTPSARRATSWLVSGDVFAVVFLSTPSARRATSTVARMLAIGGNFYPRPPRGGRLTLALDGREILHISIHALREEGDLPAPFHSRSSLRFLSTPSARRATAKTETKSLFSYKLYNILHEFRRALIYNGSKNYPNHAK